MALITFDLDGVLQQNPFRDGVRPHLYRLLTPYFRRRHPEVPPEEVPQRLLDAILGEFRRRQEAGRWVDAYNWDDIYNGLARSLGCPETIDVAALVARYCTPEYIHAYPGAAECLAALRAAGHTLKAVTNGFAAYQEPVLKALGLLDFFAAVLTPDRCGAAKPCPAIFRCAGDPPALHVGDTLVHDVYGARLAGWQSVWVVPHLDGDLARLPPWERPHHPALAALLADRLTAEREFHPAPAPAPADCQPDYVVRSLDEVPAAVAHWLGQ